MKIRKYTAQNAQEAIARVKSELGSDALIINTKKVRQKGFMGYFKKPMTEVMAAVDEQAAARAKRLSNRAREYAGKNADSAAVNDVFSQFQSHLQSSEAGGANAAEGGASSAGGGAARREEAAAPRHKSRAGATAAYRDGAGRGGFAVDSDFAPLPKSAGRAAFDQPLKNAGNANFVLPPRNAVNAGFAPPPQPGAGNAGAADDGGRRKPADRAVEMEVKITNMEAMLSKIYREVSSASKVVDENAGRLMPLATVLQLFYNNLVRNEVEPEFSMNIIEKVSDSLQDDDNRTDAATVLYNEVASVLGKPEIIDLKQGGSPTVAIFVGPTGVGKTTTLAKIAADSALNRGLNVALITADTYRIAAVQQLKTYADILGVPVAVAYSPSEIKGCIDGFSDKDLILIDTAGRSHGNPARFDELRELVREAEADEVFLVLSSTTSVKNNREIVRHYDFLDEYKLIFTKADETPVFGSMLNARMLTGKCLSYVTAGQGVPDDIEVASIDKITRSLVGNGVE